MSDDDSGKDDERLKRECREAAYNAGRVHDWLEPLLRDSVLKDRAAAERPYAFKDRTKSGHDIYLKVLSRRKASKESDPIYEPSEVKDASGFRIVKLFNDEVPQALDELLSFLKLLKEATEPTVKDNKLLGVTEIEFHTSRPNDPLSIYREVQKVATKHGQPLKPPKKNADGQVTTSNYSSVHVLVKSAVKDGGDILESHSEIQLRSVFEEAWSEISHRLKYAREKKERATGSVAIADKAQLDNAFLHLDALKSLTDGCAQYADLIAKQIKISTDGRADRSDAQPLDPADQSANKFAGYGRAMQEAVKRAYRQRSAAVEQTETGARAEGFRTAAKLFKEAMEIFKKERNAEDERLFDVLREEFAFCSLFSENDELRNGAREIYDDLRTKRPERFSVLLRLGQFHRDARDWDEAAKLFEAGLKVAKDNPDPDEDTQRQANWLLRRDLAFVLWSKVDDNPTRADADTLLRRAIEVSQEALEYVKTDNQYVNTRQNYLYYILDLLQRSSDDERESLTATGTRLLNELRPKVDLEKWSVESLDTIERAEVTLGDPAKAMAAAEAVTKKIRERIAAIVHERKCGEAAAVELLLPAERKMYLYALNLLMIIKVESKPPKERA